MFCIDAQELFYSWLERSEKTDKEKISFCMHVGAP